MGRGIASQPRTYVLAIGTSAAFGALTVAVSRVLGWATDDVVVPAIAGDGVARGRIWLAGGVLALVAVSLAAAVAGRRIFAGMGVADQQAMHRRAVTRQYLRLPMSWHRRHPTGQLLSNASADVEAATGVFNPLPFALGVVVMIAVAAVALLSTDVWLALAALVVLPAAVVANLVFQRRMSPAATRAQQLRAEVADIAHESFEAALLVKSLGTEDREERRFAERAGALRDANVRVGVVRAYFDPVIDMLPSIGTLLVLLVGVWRVSVGAVDTGDIVAAAYLLTLMAVPVRAFGWVLGELPRALVGVSLLLALVVGLWLANATVIVARFSFRTRDTARLAAYSLFRHPGTALATASLLVVATGLLVLLGEWALLPTAGAFAWWLHRHSRALRADIEERFTA
ncbi:ABC transporter ATP-binding protein [Cellulomonas hominis]|nr:ABC transporter ATP-binding protein [Cellulomonas hominis]